MFLRAVIEQEVSRTCNIEITKVVRDRCREWRLMPLYRARQPAAVGGTARR